MYSFKGLVLVVLLLFISVHDTIGIDCYNCDGDSQCDDPFDKDYYNDKAIPSPDGWCWKVIIRKEDGKSLVSRGVGPISDGSQWIECTKKKCNVIMDSDMKLDYCCCKTSLCNSAGRITLTVSILLTILFTII